MIHLFSEIADAEQNYPVYNLVPPPGQPAELGFSYAARVHIPILFRLRSGGDYGITAVVPNIPDFRRDPDRRPDGLGGARRSGPRQLPGI